MIQLRYPHYTPECSENIDGNEMINVALNDYRSVCWSCTLYIVLFVIFLIISIRFNSVFIHFYWYLKKILTSLMLILALKQQFIIHINGKYQIN